jgi:hypothetical protein
MIRRAQSQSYLNTWTPSTLRSSRWKSEFSIATATSTQPRLQPPQLSLENSQSILTSSATVAKIPLELQQLFNTCEALLQKDITVTSLLANLPHSHISYVYDRICSTCTRLQKFDYSLISPDDYAKLESYYTSLEFYYKRYFEKHAPFELPPRCPDIISLKEELSRIGEAIQYSEKILPIILQQRGSWYPPTPAAKDFVHLPQKRSALLYIIRLIENDFFND